MKQLFIAGAACEDSLYPFIHNIIKKVSKYWETWCWGEGGYAPVPMTG